MSMDIGINTQKPDEGRFTRELQDVACGVWFTRTGRIMPKTMKYQDAEGMIQFIGNIQVHSHEKKYYCGIPLWEYRCSTVCEGREYQYRLYYYIDTGCWKVSWGG